MEDPCADPEGGTGGPDPTEKSQKYNYRVSWQYWSGSPETSLSYQTSIQFWAIIGPPCSFAGGPMMAYLS